MQLLSTLILLSWTICNGSALPSLVRFVTLPKNFNHHTTVPDKDHQASDFWWDDKDPPKFDLQQDIQIPNSTLHSLLAPFILNITFIHKTPLFSKTAESSDLLLLHTPHSHPNHRTNHDLHPSNIHSPFIAAKPEIFISRRSTTKQSQYRNLRFSETITTQKISNYLTSLFLSMSQRAVLRLSKPASSTMTSHPVEQLPPLSPIGPNFLIPVSKSRISQLTRVEADALIIQLCQKSSNYSTSADSTEYITSLIANLRRANLSKNTAY